MIKVYSAVLKDGLDGRPFVPDKKSDLWDYIPVVGPIISGISDFITGSSTNKTNREIAEGNQAATHEANLMNQQNVRETNALNRSIFDQNLLWQEKMWNKQNAYNDPKAQVERLLAAGINPASVQSTPAGSVGSASAPTMQAAQVIPETLDYQQQRLNFGDLGSGLSAFFQNQLLNSQIKEKDVDTQIKKVQLQYQAANQIADLYEKRARVANLVESTKTNSVERRKYESELKQIDMQIGLFKDTYEELRSREKLQNDLLNEQKNNLVSDTQLKRIQSRYQNVVLEYYPQMTQAQLNVMSAQIGNIVQDTENKVRDGQLTDEKRISQFIENGIKKLDLWEKEFKHGVNYGTHGTKTIKAFSDYVSGLILGNLKLFGR